MAYVGTPIDTRNQFQSLQGKRFNGDGSTTAFTLDVAPSSTLDIEVFVGNVRQDPNSAYTVSGTTLTFTGAPPSGTNNIYVVHQAKSVGTIDVPDDIISGKTLVTADSSADHVLIEDATDGELKKALIPSFDTDAAVVFNESGAAVDFRVESNTDANCFIVDGSGDKVGMGLAVPEGKLHIFTADASVGPNGDADELVIENGTSGAGVGISLLSATNGEGRINFGDSGDDNIGSIFYNHGDNSMKLIANANDALEITSDGRGLSQFTAKVWANLNGNSFGLRDSHNISSATDNGSGDYTFTFSNSLANTTYSVVSTCSNGETHGDFQGVDALDNSTGSVRMFTCFVSATNSASSAHDVLNLHIAIFGD